jgi:hypothetical protein
VGDCGCQYLGEHRVTVSVSTMRRHACVSVRVSGEKERQSKGGVRRIVPHQVRIGCSLH